MKSFFVSFVFVSSLPEIRGSRREKFRDGLDLEPSRKARGERNAKDKTEIVKQCNCLRLPDAFITRRSDFV